MREGAECETGEFGSCSAERFGSTAKSIQRGACLDLPRNTEMGCRQEVLETAYVNVLFCPVVPDFRRSIALWKVSRLRLLILLARAACS